MITFPVSKPSIGDAEKKLVSEVLDAGWLTHGPLVEEFEREFAQRVGSAHAIATCSGTTALHLALAAMGVGPGDEVVIPDLTFVATANAVKYVGATPVLIDVDRDTWCLDLTLLERVVTHRTRVILPVHLYGVMCDVSKIRDMYPHILILEDACEALGNSDYGSRGNAAVFSFYGNKIITTGEGGMVVTDDLDLCIYLHKLRGQAMSSKIRYFHTEVGFNFRMTSVAAALGLAQLGQIDSFLGARDAVFKGYRDEFQGVLESVPDHCAPWLFTILLPKDVSREAVAERLLEDGIETRPTFVSMHQLPMYWRAGVDDEYSVSTDLSRRGLSLPTYAELAPGDATRIAHRVLHAIEAVGGEACLNTETV